MVRIVIVWSGQVEIICSSLTGLVLKIVYVKPWIDEFSLSLLSKVLFFLHQNPLLDGGDLSTMIATGVGGSEGGLDEHGKPMYRNRRTVSKLDPRDELET